MTTEVVEHPEARGDLAALINGRSVAYTGRLATLTPEEFAHVVELHGGKFSTGIKPGRGLGVLVVGQREWPLTRRGALTTPLRTVQVRKKKEHACTTILSEEQFLDALGLLDHRENLRQLYSTSTLSEILNISRERVQGWLKAGLIRPTRTELGVSYFDFKQVSAAKTLCELTRSGVTTGRLRRSFEQLRSWMPEAQEPLRQLAMIEGDRSVVVRLEEGSLAEADGQFRIEFEGRADPAPPMKLVQSPHTAGQWFEQGLEQERNGVMNEAAASYRQALLMGGPDADVCFCLANVLREIGKGREAVERYLQAVEINPQFVDAWNNLGTVLAELGKRDEACLAFRKALEVDPDDARGHYNMADTLDEMGRSGEAETHWQAYLQYDHDSVWADHARQRLG